MSRSSPQEPLFLHVSKRTPVTVHIRPTATRSVAKKVCTIRKTEMLSYITASRTYVYKHEVVVEIKVKESSRPEKLSCLEPVVSSLLSWCSTHNPPKQLSRLGTI